MYSRWFFSIPFADVAADLVLQLELGEDLLGPVQDLLQALLDVERLEDLDLLLDRQVGRVPGRVGDLPDVRDASEELRHLGHAAGLDDRLERRLVLVGELTGALGRDLGVRPGLDLHPRGLAGAGHARADDGADHPPDHQGLETAGEAAHVLDLRNGADLRVSVADPGHEQQLAVRGLGGGYRPPGLIGLDREGHDHPGQHNARGQGQERQDLGVELGHVGFVSFVRLCRVNALLRHAIPQV